MQTKPKIPRPSKKQLRRLGIQPIVDWGRWQKAMSEDRALPLETLCAVFLGLEPGQPNLPKLPQYQKMLSEARSHFFGLH